MAQLNADLLTDVTAKLIETRAVHFSPAERGEVLRIAQGFACKDSAAAAGVCYETIRARRKRIYRKLGVSGAGEVISSLLLIALEMLASAGVRADVSPANVSAGVQTTALTSMPGAVAAPDRNLIV